MCPSTNRGLSSANLLFLSSSLAILRKLRYAEFLNMRSQESGQELDKHSGESAFLTLEILDCSLDAMLKENAYAI